MDVRIYDRTTGAVFNWSEATDAQRAALRRAAPHFPPGIVVGIRADERGDLWIVGTNGDYRVSPGLFRAASPGGADTPGGDNWQRFQNQVDN
jgi:hypothetical protein